MSGAPDDELLALERLVRAAPELPMRRELLLEQLEQRPVEQAYSLLAGVVNRAGNLQPGLELLREVALAVLRDGGAERPLPYELRTALYGAAHAEGDAFVMRLLRSADAAARMKDPTGALPRSVADLPLGVRRSLSRGADLPMLERLMLDADSIVIGQLLENPRITEAHVVRIAARRPIPETTLRAIEQSRRFGTRPAVRIAISRNPYCPTDLAVLLLATLPLVELRQIARDQTLHATTQLHAREELERRSASGED